MNKIISEHTLIFAHRGANQEAAENTRLAFEKALQYPIDGIETDVQLSRDEVPLLWHDRFMEKLGFPEKRIDDFDFAQLERMNFASFFTERNEPEGALGLQEFIDHYRGRCKLQIEIKNRDWEPVVRHHIKIKKSMDMIGPVTDHEVFISSFNLNSLIYANQYSNKIPLYYAVEEKHSLRNLKVFLDQYPFLSGMCMPIDILSPDITEFLHRHNKGILTYTCNDDAQIQHALDMHVDILITDDPNKAISLRNQCEEI
jgi:glycerophosphoryl diester phosphodiesterase